MKCTPSRYYSTQWPWAKKSFFQHHA